ncbi:hypothetical protein D3C86_1396920 [compost metagenome]
MGLRTQLLFSPGFAMFTGMKALSPRVAMLRPRTADSSRRVPISVMMVSLAKWLPISCSMTALIWRFVRSIGDALICCWHLAEFPGNEATVRPPIMETSQFSERLGLQTQMRTGRPFFSE